MIIPKPKTNDMPEALYNQVFLAYFTHFILLTIRKTCLLRIVVYRFLHYQHTSSALDDKTNYIETILFCFVIIRNHKICPIC